MFDGIYSVYFPGAMEVGSRAEKARLSAENAEEGDLSAFSHLPTEHDYLPGVPTVAAKKIRPKNAKRASSSEAEDVLVNFM
jgi:hypothetical protein